MSLIVLSSEQQNYGSSGQSFIELPYSFKNYFQRPITIPKNSSVALQSIRFQDSKTVQLGLTQNMHIFIGEELDRASNTYLEDTTSFPIITSFASAAGTLGNTNNFPSGTVSADDFAPRLENILNKFTLHPEFEQKQSVSLEQTVTTNIFEGFDIKFDQYNTSGTTQIPQTWQPWKSTSENFSWDAVDTLQRTVSKTGGAAVKFDDRCVAIGTDYPLSLAGGSVDFKWVALGGLYKDFRVGLTRATTQSIPSPPNLYDGGDITTNYEYVVEMVDEEIAVYQMVTNLYSTKREETVMREIDYDNATNSSYSGAKYPAVRTGHIGIRFTVENEKVSIYMIKSDSSLVALVIPLDTTNLDEVTTPLNQSQWYLYPKIELANQNQQMKITEYRSHGAVTYGRSWYNGCINNVFRNGLQWLNSVENRYIFDRGVTQIRNYKGLNASGGVDVNVVMVVGDDLLYDPLTTGSNNNNTRRSLYPTANVTRMLGFEPYSIIDSTYNIGSGSLYNYISVQAPIYYDITHPLLVRLNGLPITTYNGAKSGTSKVIYSLGQYSSDSEGVVFLAPPQLIFIDIGNTEEINISQIGIDLVDIFEKFKTGITGKSIVTLVIKPKEK